MKISRSPLSLFSFVVTNAASTEVRGLEVDLLGKRPTIFDLGHIALNDGKYGSYPGAGCTNKQASELLGLALPPATLTPLVDQLTCCSLLTQ